MFSRETQSSDLTSADCDNILKIYCKEDGCTETIGFDVSPLFDKIAGFMGKHLKLTIKYKTKSSVESARFFLKSTTKLDNPCVLSFPEVHNKEIATYHFIERFNKEFGQILTINSAPILYLNHAESQSIVLEDLTLRGFRMPDSRIVDKTHMLLAIKIVAKLHAASFIHEENKSKQLGRKYRLIEDYSEDLQEIMFSKHYVNGYKYTMAAIHGVCSLTEKLEPDNRISVPEFKRQILLATEKLFDLLADSTTYRCVWNHGDLCAKNLMYRYNKDLVPIECQFMDFQLTRYAPPALDLTMLIYHTVDDVTFRTEYHNFLKYYYQCLEEALGPSKLDLNKLLAKDVFVESCDVYMHCAKVIKVIYRPMSASNYEAYKELCKDLVRFEKINFEDRTEYVLENFEKDLDYRKHLIEIMDVLKEMIVEYIHKD